MTLHEFIFTKKQAERSFRHIAFWLAQCVFWIFWATSFFLEKSWWEYINWHFKYHCYFILDIAYTYFVVYYLTPKYLVTKRFFKFGMTIFILTLFAYLFFMLYGFWFHSVIRLPMDEQLLPGWFISMNFIINGPPVVCAMFLTFKMLKNYYIKMEEKTTLIKETSSAELQLLKAQIHPHFLFNTLNNIYSFNLNKSPQAAGLVLKLSDTLKYMISDCEAELVPLDKELKMLQDYIGLEKVRYGKRLKMEVEIKGNYENKVIAPLLLIPFVENSFKHGSSKMLEHPWIRMQVSIEDWFLDFRISNSKPLNPAKANGTKGIGLKNVRKRLQLLYPGEHQLEINSEDQAYQVKLRMPLHAMKSENTAIEEIETPALTESYATQ